MRGGRGAWCLGMAPCMGEGRPSSSDPKKEQCEDTFRKICPRNILRHLQCFINVSLCLSALESCQSGAFKSAAICRIM